MSVPLRDGAVHLLMADEALVSGIGGTYLAQCGIRFAPLRLPLDRIALPGHPQDVDHIRPRCRDRAAGGAR